MENVKTIYEGKYPRGAQRGVLLNKIIIRDRRIRVALNECASLG